MLKKYKQELTNRNQNRDKIVEGLTIIIAILLIIKHYELLETIPTNNLTPDRSLVIFCPGCKTEFLTFLNQSKEIKCAFYSLNDQDVVKILDSKNSTIKIFYSNFRHTLDVLNALNTSDKTGKYIPVYSYRLMHHKFCILDNKYVLIGSINPTPEGFSQYNDFLVIQSEELVEELNKEFFRLGNDIDSNNIVDKLIDSLFFKNKKILICRKDLCKKRLMYEIKKSKEKIWFAHFLITDNDIVQLLLEKSQTLNIKGIISKQNINLKGSDYYRIKNFTKPCKDIHLKLWIIDNKVITGSLNPSESGFSKNDELMLIITDNKIVEKYTSEFIKLFNKTC